MKINYALFTLQTPKIIYSIQDKKYTHTQTKYYMKILNLIFLTLNAAKLFFNLTNASDRVSLHTTSFAIIGS